MDTELKNNISKEYIQNLEDFKILEKIINKEIEIKDLDYEVKTRLIFLCNKRTQEINEKIKKLKNK